MLGVAFAGFLLAVVVIMVTDELLSHIDEPGGSPEPHGLRPTHGPEGPQLLQLARAGTLSKIPQW